VSALWHDATRRVEESGVKPPQSKQSSSHFESKSVSISGLIAGK
jgi:hypothetical protein